jgi:chemotaxis protein methyltransferase CheR
MQTENGLQRLVTLIRERTGNVVPQSRYAFLEELIQRRTHSRRFSTPAEYLRELEAGGIPGEWESLIPLVTIKESYFFRAPQQFEIIRGQILPQLLRARAPEKHLRIWSAACARGEEPATLAMVLAEERALSGWTWSILASDIDEEALAGARLGLYGERALAQVPPPLLERYFRPRGKLYELDPALRAQIEYRPLNLAQLPYSLPERAFDLILLRNVLIYFRQPLQRRVVAEAAQHLSAEGYLFLGASETLWQIQEEGLEAAGLGSCFAYRHPRGPRKEARREPVPPPVVRPEPGLEERSLDATWPEPAATRSAPEPPIPPCGLQERLLDAARSLAGNRIEEAGRALEQVLEADPSEPAVHALEGFLHDITGRTEEAVVSYRAALYLDPTLYQVRVLLADCLLRLGNRNRAEHHYREVLTDLGNGRERDLLVFGELPFPDRLRAQRRCRQVLGGTGS